MNELRTQLRTEMFGLVEQYLKGNVKKRIFCEQHGISLWKFFYWHKKYKEEIRESNSKGPGKFLRVNAGTVNFTGSEKLLLHYPNGVTVEVSNGMKLSEVRTLILG